VPVTSIWPDSRIRSRQSDAAPEAGAGLYQATPCSIMANHGGHGSTPPSRHRSNRLVSSVSDAPTAKASRSQLSG
jgi:hypothetical protein